MREYDFTDNPRIARIGDENQEKEYKRQQKRGCCGFYDETITIDGLDYYFGFNYGH